MDKKMEDIILRDLGISVKEIRDASWEDLEPINISLRRETEMFRITITIHEIFREACFRFKCLIKLKNNM